ncbi:MAG: purine-binding chemotaxis protein CheW [Deltaproteobacteria bacterium]|nr:purine-binding chemotaxis protein CheW [Deltaproteobacteria bacterium]
MAHAKQDRKNAGVVELTTFYVGDALCGMDILNVQEINKHMEMTKVPQAPECVMGILNLRGQIVTIIDLGKRLGLPPTERTGDSRNIIVNSHGEHIGLNVQRISDVVQANWDEVEPPPANIGGVQGRFFEGVYKTENTLVGILNVEEVLKDEEEA